MPMRGSQPELPGHDGEDGSRAPPGPGLVEWSQLVLGAVRRRKWLALAAFVVGIDATVAYYRLRAPTYHVETKILAQRQQTLPSIVRPTVGDDVPTRLAGELVHRRENLIALIQETDLMAEPGVAPPQGWLGRTLAALRLASPPPTAEDRLNDLVLRVDRALMVYTSEGTVTIEVEWPDPQQAYRLVEAALQNFLEARHLQEITAIDEVISLLQGRVAALRAEVERAVLEPQRGAAMEGGGSQRPAARRLQPDEDLVRIRSMLEAKARAIADVEEFRRRRLADLQAQLDAQRAVYSDAYPGVISLRQDIEALTRESPQIASLRDEERKLRTDYVARLARQGSAIETYPAANTPRPGPSLARQKDERVREARYQYQQMVERINAAQLDLDAARAAFKYRYNVIWPPEVPRKPASPDPRKVFGLGVLASLALALLAAVAPDLWAGRAVEAWQVERALDLPVIARLRRR